MNSAAMERDGLLDFAKRSAVAWGVGLLLVLLAVGTGYAIDVLLLAFAGVLFAIFLRGLSGFLMTYVRLSENWALTAAVLLVVGATSAGVWGLTPSVSEQASQLRRSLPKAAERIEEQARRYEWGRWLLDHAPRPNDMVAQQGRLIGRITGVVSGTLEAIGALIVIFFTGLYLAAQPRLYIEGIVKLVAIRKRARARDVILRIGEALKWWLVGQLTAMAFIGVLTWLGLWLLGIEMALALAVLAALLTFIPNFGPIISAIPAVLIGLLDGPATAAWVVALYIAIQTVESYLITPLIQQRAISLPPALTITTQLIMATFVGTVGLALATPATVALLTMTRMLYVEDVLGDRSGKAGASSMSTGSEGEGGD